MVACLIYRWELISESSAIGGSGGPGDFVIGCLYEINSGSI